MSWRQPQPRKAPNFTKLKPSRATPKLVTPSPNGLIRKIIMLSPVLKLTMLSPVGLVECAGESALDGANRVAHDHLPDDLDDVDLEGLDGGGNGFGIADVGAE
jgi:hypothetical protein